MDSLANLQNGGYHHEYSAKSWKVKVVKNFMLQNVFHIIFLILLLLTKAILNTQGDKTEIQPPDNYSIRELEMRKKCSEPQFISLTLPSSSHKGYKVQFSWKSSLSSGLLHGTHMQPCVWEPLHQQSQATVTGDFLQGLGDLFYMPCFNFIAWAYSTPASSTQIYKNHLCKLQDLLISEFILFNLKMKQSSHSKQSNV